MRVESQPGKVQCDFHTKVVFDLVQWLVTKKVFQRGPFASQDASQVVLSAISSLRPMAQSFAHQSTITRIFILVLYVFDTYKLIRCTDEMKMNMKSNELTSCNG